MDQREVLRKMAFTALGLVLAIEIVAIAGADAQPAESVYAQGEYVQTLEGAKSPFADVVQTVMPCVVGVSNRANTFNMISGQTELIEQATGSGVVVTTQGHVVTNYHVIEGANDVQVLSQGRYLKTEIVGYDELTDLAVLRVMEDVASACRQDGGYVAQVRVGDWAIVIGNPLGKQFADTVTVGVVSALNRELEGSSIVKMLQTDAAINSGNSGGGLFNTRGELIGVPSLKFSSNGKDDVASIEGIAMAIPVDVVQPVVNSIIQYGRVTRPEAGHFRHNHPRKRQTDGRFYSGRRLRRALFRREVRQKKPGSSRTTSLSGWMGKRIALHTDLTNRLAARAAGDVVGADGLPYPRP